MIRSSLESKIYILEGPRPAYQLARRAGLASEPRPRGSVLKPRPNWTRRILLITLAAIILGTLLVYRFRTGHFNGKYSLTTFYHVNWLWLGISVGLMLTITSGAPCAGRSCYSRLDAS